MRCAVLILGLMVMSLQSPAWAQERQKEPAGAATQPARSSGDDDAASRDRATIRQAFFASGLTNSKPVLRVDYDAAGLPVKVALKTRSGDAALDAAILAWGRQLRMRPGHAGHGFVPFDLSRVADSESVTRGRFSTLRADFERAQVLKVPAFDPVEYAFLNSNLSRAAIQLEVRYDGHGDVSDVKLLSRTLASSLNRALADWAKQLKFKAGKSDTIRFDLQIESF